MPHEPPVTEEPGSAQDASVAKEPQEPRVSERPSLGKASLQPSAPLRKQPGESPSGGEESAPAPSFEEKRTEAAQTEAANRKAGGRAEFGEEEKLQSRNASGRAPPSPKKKEQPPATRLEALNLEPLRHKGQLALRRHSSSFLFSLSSTLPFTSDCWEFSAQARASPCVCGREAVVPAATRRSSANKAQTAAKSHRLRCWMKTPKRERALPAATL